MQGPTVTPCDQCESCRAIAIGEDVDVIEIDGASNNRVEEIRELRSNAQYRPTRSRYKIYIIDEVHMLTTSAFNALLKTLEEPPPHVKFIFATTEVHKVPLTILSRCQRFDFASIRTEDIVKQLHKIVAAEGVRAEEEALRLIARRASGSLRDAESLLDQALAFGEGQLTLAQVEQLLGLAGEEHILALGEAILDREAAKAWTLLDEAFRRGAQPGELLDQLLEYWRDLLLLQTVGESCESFYYADRHLQRMQRRAESLPLDAILTAMDLIAGTKGRLRGSSHPRVLVEMLMIRLTQLESLLAIKDLIERLNTGGRRWSEEGDGGRNLRARGASSAKPGGSDRPFASNAPELPTEAPPDSQGEKVSARAKVAESGNVAGGSLAAQIELAPGLEGESVGGAASSGAQLAWAGATEPIEFCEANLGQLRQALLESFGASLLRFDLEQAVLAICAPNCLALRFAAEYNAQKARCERRRADLEEALRRILRRDIQLRFETITGFESPQRKGASSKTADRLQLLEQIPLIREAVRQLGARFLAERVEPGFGQEELGNWTEANP
ncbi:DNA polymerase III subunit tau [bacterium HR36]|nr:DNA polymerase III subunit tau [bacterium HR36]